MKKLSVVLAAFALIAASFVGCASNEVVSTATSTVADATMNTWYKYAKNVNVDLGTTDNSAADASTSAAAFANTYVRYTTEGLTIVMEQNPTSGSTKPLRASKTYTTEEFGMAKWTALVASGKIAQASEPASVTTPADYTDISDVATATSEGVKGGVQWKKLLANQLLTWLE